MTWFPEFLVNIETNRKLLTSEGNSLSLYKSRYMTNLFCLNKDNITGQFPELTTPFSVVLLPVYITCDQETNEPFTAFSNASLSHLGWAENSLETTINGLRFGCTSVYSIRIRQMINILENRQSSLLDFSPLLREGARRI